MNSNVLPRLQLLWMASTAEALLKSPIGKTTLMNRAVEAGITAERTARGLQRTVCTAFSGRSERTVHFHDGGSGPAIVLINGWTASGAVWPRRLVDRLERNSRVIRVDNRGTGGSLGADAPFTVADMADDVAAVIRQEGLGGAVIVGLSMGGMITQEFAIRHPDLTRGVVLLGTRPPAPAFIAPPHSTITTMLSSAGRMERTRESLRERWTKIAGPAFADDDAMIDEMANHLADPITPISSVATQARAVAAWHGPNRLRRITAPTTIVHGTVDPLIPIDNGRVLAGLIPGARLVEANDIGHLVPFEAPDLVATEIEQIATPTRK